MNMFTGTSAIADIQTPQHIYESDNPSFSLSKIKDAVAICAETVFGVKTLFPYQRLVIANILDAVAAASTPLVESYNREDATSAAELFDEDGILRAHQIVLLPTGSGKSLCFQIPAVLLEGTSLIIYPLLALMNEQYKRLQTLGLNPVLLCGGQSATERATQLACLADSNTPNAAKIIIANPEILQNPEVFRRLQQCTISFVAIDEAHCLSEWGDTFRPSYLQLPQLITKLNPKSISAFTATAGEQILTRIKDLLFAGQAHLVQSASDRSNLSYNVIHCRCKIPILLQILQQRSGPALVFCSSRLGVERRAELIRHRLHTQTVRFYHAELSSKEKHAIETWFQHSNDGILIATCAWGMGLDKKNVRTVIHLDPSPSIESYLQESGRAGRDKAPAQVFLLWAPDDSKRIATLPKNQRQRAQLMKEYAFTTQCRRSILLPAIGDKPANRGEGDRVFCANCDICTGTAKRRINDEVAVYNIVKQNHNRLTGSELIKLCTECSQFYRSGDINLLITSLEQAGKIKIPRHGLHKGQIIATKAKNKRLFFFVNLNRPACP